MVGFTLSDSEKSTRVAARGFAKAHLAGAKAIYSNFSTPAGRFQSIQPLYEAVKAGLIKGQVPAPVGGTSANLVEAAILVEGSTPLMHRLR
ncbi:hypothetical protein V1522DRAFT_34217 [Lipomyces starkeyi]